MRSNSIKTHDFWDRKILKWESKKYGSTPKPGRIFSLGVDVNSSVKMRFKIAEGILSELANDRIICEVGCGSARLLPAISKSNFRKYIGIDISKEAIREASLRAETLGCKEKTEFLRTDINDVPHVDCDICFSLGLLDWLSLDQINLFASKVSCRYFFHTFSERRFSLHQTLHKVYVYVLYGHKSKAYIPQYYTENDIRRALGKEDDKEVNLYRSPQLSFGVFMYKLPYDAFL
jgi:hypothetical protein